jgi:hypothetical protein
MPGSPDTWIEFIEVAATAQSPAAYRKAKLRSRIESRELGALFVDPYGAELLPILRPADESRVGNNKMRRMLTTGRKIRVRRGKLSVAAS